MDGPGARTRAIRGGGLGRWRWSAKAIATLEARIGHPLPAGFRAYLAHFGSVCVGDQTLTGIRGDDPTALDVANTVGATLQLREWAPDLPPAFVRGWVLADWV